MENCFLIIIAILGVKASVLHASKLWLLKGSGSRLRSFTKQSSSSLDSEMCFQKKLLVASCSYLFLVVRSGAPSSVIAPSSDARSP